MAQQGASQKKKLSSSSQNIKVVVRVRPLSNEEKERKIKTVVQCISLRDIQAKEKKYQFDRVFEPDSSQMDIYSFVVAPMISDVLAGYNCTVFAYGQTGTGKTHTMTGADHNLTVSNWKQDELAGCIPRAAANIFDEIGLMNVEDYNVRVSFLELYNEEVRDLLSPEERPLPLNIFNDSKGSVCIQNLNEMTVFNSNDIYMLLQQGTLKRQTAATLMNNHSSRSHTVFTITVHIREANLTDEVLKTGKINLVDLAGSENIAKSGAKDKRAQELANINKSLLTLGRVIQILAEKNNKHIPYRDSKLTRILQDSLGGHTKTCIIATVSPTHTSFEETQSTLEYACRARDIRNTPMVNEKITKARMIKEMTVEIEKLKKDLDAARCGDGFFINRNNWEELNSQLQSNSNTVSLKNEIIQDMKKKLSDLEMIKDIKCKEYEDAMNTCKHKEKIIDKAKILLKESRVSLKQEQFLSRHYLEALTEKDKKAKELLEATNNLSRNQDILQIKLENQYMNNYTNEKIINETSTSLRNNLKQVVSKIDDLNYTACSVIADQRSELCATKNLSDDYLSNKKKACGLQKKLKLDLKFGKHPQLIKGDITKCRGEMTEKLGLLKDFEKKVDFKNTKMNSLLSDLRAELLNGRMEEEEKLREFERFADFSRVHISNFNTMLSMIDSSEILCDTTNDEVNGSNEPLSQSLQNTVCTLDTEIEHLLENEEILIKTIQQCKEDADQMVCDSLEADTTFVNALHTSQDSLDKIVNSLQDEIENRLSELKTIVQKAAEMESNRVSKIARVNRVGDTPKQNNINYPKRISEGTLSRDVLIKKFKEEYSEDVENESFYLNVSLESAESLNDCEISDNIKTEHPQ